MTAGSEFQVNVKVGYQTCVYRQMEGEFCGMFLHEELENGARVRLLDESKRESTLMGIVRTTVRPFYAS